MESSVRVRGLSRNRWHTQKGYLEKSLLKRILFTKGSEGLKSNVNYSVTMMGSFSSPRPEGAKERSDWYPAGPVPARGPPT